MTKSDLMEWRDRVWGKDTSILDICLQIHMACNGSADPMPLAKLTNARLMLELRLETWTDPTYSALDDAVESLIQATIRDIWNYEARTCNT